MTAAYQQAQATSPARIVLDFNRVDYINSTGIALVVGLLAKARAAHIPLGSRGPQRPLSRDFYDHAAV